MPRYLLHAALLHAALLHAALLHAALLHAAPPIHLLYAALRIHQLYAAPLYAALPNRQLRCLGGLSACDDAVKNTTKRAGVLNIHGTADPL
eukprot:gene6595-6887_t